jgi:DNA replication protein DnaC
MVKPKKPTALLDPFLEEGNFRYIQEHYQPLAKEAATREWDHIDYLAPLIEGEVLARRDRSVQRRIRMARFPVEKSLDSFDWTWPKKISTQEVRHLFRLDFIEQKANVIFLGGVGLGKSHLSIALGYAACLQGYSVRFANAIEIVNTMLAARASNSLKQELRKYARPQLLVIDELGYLPVDQMGAELLFQVISQRYECGSIVLNSNKAYKDWPEIFHNDSTITSAVLDRVLHHSDTITITGRSYRMKDQKSA